MAFLIGQAIPLPISVDSADYIDHVAGTIAHSVVASSNPLATESLLKSNASGYLRLVRLGLGMDPSHPLDVAGNIRLSGDLLHSDDLDIEATGGDINLVNTDIQAHNWTSGTTGWGISHAGDADFRNITADSLYVEAFISDVNLALAGSQIITKSLAVLSRPFTVPSTTGSLYVFDLPGLPNTAVFENGDIVRLRYVVHSTGLVVGDIWGTVSSYADQAAGEQRWTFTRTSGTAGTVIAEGMIALDYGASGDGYVHTTTLDTAGSPYTEVGTWVTDPSSGANHTIHVRLGQLDGIAGIGDEWGLWAGQAGEVYLLLSDTNFEAHGLALSLYDSNGEAIRLDPDAPSLAIGWPLPTGPSAGGAGLWAGLSGGNYQLRLGEAAGVGLRWDGDDLTIRNASDAAVITLDAAGNSYFAGPMTLGASGGIYQGTGTFASPTTGLKIWNDGGYGNIAVYETGTKQVWLDETGLILNSVGVVSDPNAANTIRWLDGSEIMGQIWSMDTPQINGVVINGYGQDTDQSGAVYLRANGKASGVDQSALLQIAAGNATSTAMFFSLNGTERFRLEPAQATVYTDLRVQDGVWVGATNQNPDTDDLHLEGNLKSYKNSTNYDVYAMHYLTTALTSTSWDGDSKTSANNGTIDLSAVFGVPAEVKAVLVRLSVQSATPGSIAYAGPSSSQSTALPCRAQVAGVFNDTVGIIPCNASGDIYITFSGTVDVFLQIWGYAL